MAGSKLNTFLVEATSIDANIVLAHAVSMTLQCGACACVRACVRGWVGGWVSGWVGGCVCMCVCVCACVKSSPFQHCTDPGLPESGRPKFRLTSWLGNVMWNDF